MRLRLANILQCDICTYLHIWPDQLRLPEQALHVHNIHRPDTEARALTLRHNTHMTFNTYIVSSINNIPENLA